jgi:transcription initiation factor TFIIIB Brf1 subunit/transcription initiation factor TFIIB
METCTKAPVICKKPAASKQPKKPTTKTTPTNSTETLPSTLPSSTLPSSTLPSSTLPSSTKTLPSSPTTLPSTEATWDQLFAEMSDVAATPTKSTSESDSTEHLRDAAVYSISVVEAMEQIQTHIDNMNSSLEAKISIVQEQATTGCYSCGGLLRTKNNIMSCQSCGLEIKDALVSTPEDECLTTSQDCNVNDKGFISMRVVGKNVYGYNCNLMQNCADYNRYRKMTTRKEMHNWNSQSTGIQVPKNVIEDANNMFAVIKDHGYVYRKDVKKGVQGGCLYYACYQNGVSRTHTEIAQLVGVAEKFLSLGDRILRDLNERGVITIPARIDSVTNYINRYFELLGIPDQYKPFIIDIINQADEDRLHVLHDSKSNTKCIGTIYLLIERVPELRKMIDKERIEKECQISKTTFIKYHTMLCKYYKKFVHVFAEHGIPLKSEWREESAKPKAKPKQKATRVKPIIKHTVHDDPDSPDSPDHFDSLTAETLTHVVKTAPVKPVKPVMRPMVKPRKK